MTGELIKIGKAERKTAESRKQKAESGNSIQLFRFRLSTSPSRFVDHRGHYRHEFIGFFFHWQSVRRSNAAFLTEQLQPHLRFISLLQRTTEFGDKFFT
jgi:hypothetical protein